MDRNLMFSIGAASIGLAVFLGICAVSPESPPAKAQAFSSCAEPSTGGGTASGGGGGVNDMGSTPIITNPDVSDLNPSGMGTLGPTTTIQTYGLLLPCCGPGCADEYVVP